MGSLSSSDIILCPVALGYGINNYFVIDVILKQQHISNNILCQWKHQSAYYAVLGNAERIFLSVNFAAWFIWMIWPTDSILFL